MLGLKLNHVSKRGPVWKRFLTPDAILICISKDIYYFLWNIITNPHPNFKGGSTKCRWNEAMDEYYYRVVYANVIINPYSTHDVDLVDLIYFSGNFRWSHINPVSKYTHNARQHAHTHI